MKKRIIITGATSGIGLATAEMLYNHGHQLFLTGRNTIKLNEFRSGREERVGVFAADVREYSEVKGMVTRGMEYLGGLDVLVNNAGLGYFEKIADGQIEQWHQMFDVNVKGVLNCIHATLPYLLETNGLIVQVASIAAHHVFPNSGVYCATKHAVAAISESLRLELAGKIKVSTISPGAVNTNFINTTTDEEMLKDYRDYFATSLPPSLVAEQILNCVNSPDHAVLSEIIIRPNRKNK